MPATPRILAVIESLGLSEQRLIDLRSLLYSEIRVVGGANSDSVTVRESLQLADSAIGEAVMQIRTAGRSMKAAADVGK